MPTTKKPPLSWKAKRRGDVYCSPACGRKCTWAEYQRAKRRAKELVRKLGKDKWEPEVHENLGWHYSARSKCGRMSVCEHWPWASGDEVVDKLAELVPESYSCYMNEPSRMPGGRWVGKGGTPQEAVDDAIARAVAERDGINVILEGLE